MKRYIFSIGLGALVFNGCGVTDALTGGDIKDKDEIIIYYVNRTAADKNDFICIEGLLNSLVPDHKGTISSVEMDSEDATCEKYSRKNGEKCVLENSKSSYNRACVIGYDLP